MNNSQAFRFPVFLTRLKKSKFLRYGLPMITFVVIGSFGLAEFTAIRVKKRDEKTRMLTAEESLQFQKKVEKVDVGQEWEKMQDTINIDKWENKRGPRPWEEGTPQSSQ